MSFVPASPIDASGRHTPEGVAGDDDSALARGGFKSSLRGFCDGLACLAIAVMALRSFFVEGYMISTGSMAPALLGYHKRVVCPTCGAPFARGVDIDKVDAAVAHALPPGTTCPNCGQTGIDLSQVPRNHGDQMLVFKQAFRIRDPHRWEIAVFHNPADPTKVFVKRIVGLPGEAIQVVDGNVYADGTICRKSLAIQRVMRIPVFQARYCPSGANGGSEKASATHWATAGQWQATDQRGGFVFVANSAKDSDSAKPRLAGQSLDASWAWLSYRHRATTSDARHTSVALEDLPLGFAVPDSPVVEPVRFVPDSQKTGAGRLSVRGPLDEQWESRLRELSAAAEYQRAISRLAAESRHPAITDVYGYNDHRPGTQNAVTDLMVAGTIRLAGQGEFAVEIADERQRFRLVFDTGAKTLRLFRVGDAQYLRSARLPAGLAGGEAVLLEMSVFDRQVLVAIDGELAFSPWTYRKGALRSSPGSSPVRLGAKGLTARVGELTLYRDVYYTKGRRRNGIRKPCQLGEDEFFVLGDNSPLSLDSRSWSRPAVPRKLLMGKPFVVHLPSQPLTFQIGSYRFHVRIPDFGRMRYVE